MNKEDFLTLYRLVKPLENMEQEKAAELIASAMESIDGKPPEIRIIDGVAVIGNIHTGLFLLSDGILDGVIEIDGVIYAVKDNEPAN